MELGVSINAGEPAYVKECARAVESAGIDVLAHPDSQAIDREVYTSLALSAEYTEAPRLAVVATNPVTRHVTVTASAIATVDEISGGRAVLCMATGDSAVRNTELKPASLRGLGESLTAIDELFADGTTEFRDGVSNLNWPERSVPTFIATSGPKTLEVAGRIADGVVFHGGLERVDWALSRVAEGARRVGRDPDDVEFWVATPGEVANTREEAIDSLRHTLAGYVHYRAKHGALDDVPDDVADRMRRMADEYRPDLHNTFDDPHNAELIDEYDLRGAVADKPVAGTPGQVTKQLEAYDQKGVDCVLLMLRHDHPAKTVRRLGDDVVPKLG